MKGRNDTPVTQVTQPLPHALSGGQDHDVDVARPQAEQKFLTKDSRNVPVYIVSKVVNVDITASLKKTLSFEKLPDIRRIELW